MKGKEVGSRILVISFIIILTLSIVSASFLGNLLKALTGTGRAVGGGACTDSDGQGNFNVGGYVTKDGVVYYDYCAGSAAYDYYCPIGGDIGDDVGDTSPPTSGADVVLSLVRDSITGAASSITGAVVTPPPTSSIDCRTFGQGITCIGGGQCGCVDGTTKTCGPIEGNEGECNLGTTTCTNGNYPSSCQGAIYPVSETCNGLDDDCDGIRDDGNLCPSGYTCSPTAKTCVLQVGGGCTDSDNDTYSINGGNCGTIDCNDNNANINPGATEICGNGIDEDCSGADLTCPPNTITYYCDTDRDGFKNKIASGTCNQGSTGCPPLGCISTQGNDCNDNNDAINPTEDEICDDNIDNDCDDDVDDDDSECYIPPPECFDSDRDGYGKAGSTGCLKSGIDCNDIEGSGENINPGEEEVCDGIDNDCNTNTIEGNILDVVTCQPLNKNAGGACLSISIKCVSGTMETCTSKGYLNPASTENKNDDIDNNCDGTVDEGTECSTNGETKFCNTECEPGKQTCVNKEWGQCVLDSNPDLPSSCTNRECTPGNSAVCGTNLGACMVGLKTCDSVGKWGGCEGDIGPETEICNDGVDNDCDGFADGEEIDCGGDRGTAAGTDDSGTIGEEGEESSIEQGTPTTSEDIQRQKKIEWTKKSFFQKIWSVILSIFNVGRSVLGNVVAETADIHCSDSDRGKDYFNKGTGSGLNAQDEEIWFVDFCYQENQNNQVEKCGGDDCFLKEYACDNPYVNAETEIKCQYGCINGACVPDASLSDSCIYFDKETWKWMNIC